MFELESSVASWRQRMHRAGIKSISTLDELEAHLRDDFEAQVGSGTDAQEAFELATWNIGSPIQLEGEFGKVLVKWNSLRVPIGYLGAVACLQYLIFSKEFTYIPDFGQHWTCLSNLLLTSLLSFAIWGLMRHVFEIASRPSSKAAICGLVGAGGVAYVLGFTNFFLGLTNLDPAEALALIWWLLVPLHVLNLFVISQYAERGRELRA